MDETEFVQKILAEQFPEACNAVGNNTVAKIAKGQLRTKEVESGHKMDLMPILNELKQAAEFAKDVLAVYLVWIQIKKERPTEEQLRKEIEKKEAENAKEKKEETQSKGELKKEDKDAIIKRVANEGNVVKPKHQGQKPSKKKK
jgi:hypothetical protein